MKALGLAVAAIALTMAVPHAAHAERIHHVDGWYCTPEKVGGYYTDPTQPSRIASILYNICYETSGAEIRETTYVTVVDAPDDEPVTFYSISARVTSGPPTQAVWLANHSCNYVEAAVGETVSCTTGWATPPAGADIWMDGIVFQPLNFGYYWTMQQMSKVTLRHW